MEIKTTAQKVSYGYGFNIAYQLKEVLDKLDMDCLLQGLKDSQSGAPLQVKPEELDAAYKEFNDIVIAERNKKFEATQKASEAYLAENAKKEGVVVTESGLQYEVLVEGTGAKPTTRDTVKVHYHGTLVDGTVFDSSVVRDQPATFGVTQVIKGWVEGLQLMKVGSKYKFTIPANLAYGDNGAGASIPPKSALIFEVELLDIVK